jgi:FkbM family methyltransferase
LNIDKLRSLAKGLLINTFMYDFAKSLYIRLKIRGDKRMFKKKYPKATYINYTIEELSAQQRQGYYSQYGQDFYLWSEYLSNLDNGSFIDIGANKPDVNSNSIFLEKQGWSGVAIDPLKQVQSEWLEKRETPFVCGAVSDVEGNQPFIEVLPKQGWEHALSGFKEHVREEDLKIYDYREYDVATKPLNKHFPNIDRVNLILIDVEGAEMQVLRGIDFSSFKPTFLMIENDNAIGGDELIREYLKEFNYECVARIAATDDLFIRTG